MAASKASSTGMTNRPRLVDQRGHSGGDFIKEPRLNIDSRILDQIASGTHYKSQSLRLYLDPPEVF
jgi:hypothetical protein